MKELFEAIYAHYEATVLAAKLTELYNTEAPPLSTEEGDGGSVFPYGTFSLVSDVPDWTFTEHFEDILIQFDFFSKAVLATEVLEAAEALEDAFDFHDLAIAYPYTTVSLTQEVANLLPRVEGIWEYNISYRLLLERTLPTTMGISSTSHLRMSIAGELTVTP